MVKLTIERDDGSVTVVENVIDWSYWTTENVRDYLDYKEESDNVKINITDEQFKELCDEFILIGHVKDVQVDTTLLLWMKKNSTTLLMMYWMIWK